MHNAAIKKDIAQLYTFPAPMLFNPIFKVDSCLSTLKYLELQRNHFYTPFVPEMPVSSALDLLNLSYSMSCLFSSILYTFLIVLTICYFNCLHVV